MYFWAYWMKLLVLQREASQIVTIRFANEYEISAVMDFIENHWQKGYIMARNEEMVRFDWMDGQNVNIVLALEDGHIIGMEAFITYGRKYRDVMLNGWKVLKGKRTMLGMEIYEFLIQNADVRSWSGLKFQPETGIMHEYVGCWTGRLTQWYRLAGCERYNIAQVSEPKVPATVESCLWLEKFNEFNELVARFSFEEYYASNPHPLKEAWYIEKRYFSHPSYHYDVYGICDRTGKAIALLVSLFGGGQKTSLCVSENNDNLEYVAAFSTGRVAA